MPEDKPTRAVGKQMAVIHNNFVVAYTHNDRIYICAMMELIHKRNRVVDVRRIDRKIEKVLWAVLRDFVLEKHGLPKISRVS